jgi:hypothetical protein
MVIRSDTSAKNAFSRVASDTTYDIVADEYGVSRSVAQAMRQFMALKIAGFVPDGPHFELGGFLKTILGAAGMTDNPLVGKFTEALQAIIPLDNQPQAAMRPTVPRSDFNPAGMA